MIFSEFGIVPQKTLSKVGCDLASISGRLGPLVKKKLERSSPNPLKLKEFPIHDKRLHVL
jgi:hypothetical protein